tara:strand:+ start:105 stop:749 length:645 start_codon:yes stop_codon:yes gene_type:complete
MECDEDNFEPSEIETRIYGRMYDSENGIPIVNQQLKISEYNRIPGSFYGQFEFIQHLDSIKTDSQGFFNLTFKTSGKGDHYELSFQFDNYFNLKGLNNVMEIENIGVDNELNFDFTHLYPVTLKITLDNNVEFLPIRINPSFPQYYPSSNNITQTGIEFQRSIYTNKNSEQVITFNRTKPNGKRQWYIYRLPATNTTNLTETEIFIKNENFVDN